jgi:hypothetical protein
MRQFAKFTNATGLIKEVKIGFCWTFLLCGVCVTLYRGDFKNFIKIAVLSFFTMGVFSLYSCWSYNKWYAQYLMETGFSPATEEDVKLLTTYRYLYA